MLTVIYVYVMSNSPQFHYGPLIVAEKLSAKPEEYVVVTDPDHYLLEALSNPGRPVFVRSWKDTPMFDTLLEAGTNNVEYNVTYYMIEFGSLEPAFGGYWLLLLVSWIVLGVSFAITRHRKIAQP